MRITIAYDNEVKKEGLKSGWGFSAYIEMERAAPILFDTGADSPTLLHNMKELKKLSKNSTFSMIRNFFCDFGYHQITQ